MQMKVLILIRGCSGSGKSTLSKIIKSDGDHFEADMYFLDKNGEYRFDPNKLREAHKWCLDSTENSMLGEKKQIIVSNTFTMDWEMEAYFKLAEKYNYVIFTLVVENRHSGKNVHGVTEEKLEKMRKRFKIKL